MESDGLRNQTVKGVKWNSVGTITTTVLHMLKLFILARILSKSDFGLIAIATMFLGFTEIFANLGLATGLIHKQDITREQYSSVFWLNLLLSVTLYAILFALTPLIASYYHQPQLLKVIPLLSLTLVINAFGKMFYTFKTKELDFRFIAIVEVTGVSLGVIFTIVLALRGAGVFSLVYGAILQAVLTHGVYAVSGLRSYRVLWHFRLGEIKELLRIGGYQLSTQVVDYAATKLDVFLIGRFFSAEVLGVYNLAKELLYKAVQLVNPIVTGVAAPAFARFQDDKPRMRDAYGRVLTLLSFINFPIFFAVFLFPEGIVSVLYGSGMMEMVWFVRILALWGILHSIANPIAILIVSLGRTDLGFLWMCLRMVLMLIGTLVAARISIEAMTWAQVIIAVVLFFGCWKIVVHRLIGMRFAEYLRAMATPFAAACVALLLALPLLLWGDMERPMIYLADMVIFGIGYLLYYWLFNRGYLREVTGYVLKR